MVASESRALRVGSDMPVSSSPVCSAQVPPEVKEEIKEERDKEASGEDRRDKAPSEMAQSWALSGILDDVFSNTRGDEQTHQGSEQEAVHSRPLTRRI